MENAQKIVEKLKVAKQLHQEIEEWNNEKQGLELELKNGSDPNIIGRKSSDGIGQILQ